MSKYKFIIPVVLLIALIVLFSYSKIIGLAFLALVILFLVIRNRAGLYNVFAGFAYKKGDTDKALAWLKKAYHVRNSKPKIKMLYSYLLLKTGNVEEAGKTLEDIMSSKLNFEDERMAKSNYALVLWKKGRLNDAAALLEEVYTDYKTTTLYGSLGYLLILKGDLDRALKINTEAYEYNDSDPVILDNLAHTMYLRGDLSKAAELYEKLMSVNPSFPEAYYNYSLVLMEQKDYDRALSTIKKAANFKLSFLSNLTQEELTGKIKKIEALAGNKAD